MHSYTQLGLGLSTIGHGATLISFLFSLSYPFVSAGSFLVAGPMRFLFARCRGKFTSCRTPLILVSSLCLHILALIVSFSFEFRAAYTTSA